MSVEEENGKKMSDVCVKDAEARRSLELEFLYLRGEILLRSAIQNFVLAISALIFGFAIWRLQSAAEGWVVAGYLGASSGMAGVWALNDNHQIRASAYLKSLESKLGISWEKWVKSPAARLSGPIGSGHQATTRGFFLGSQIAILLLVALAGPTLHFAGLIFCVVCLIGTILVLIPPKIAPYEGVDPQ